MKSITNLGDFSDVKVGDIVTRLLAGTVEMKLNVVKVDDKLIYAVAPDGPQNDPWTFDRKCGIEEDEFLGWGVKFRASGSYLVSVERAGNAGAVGVVSQNAGDPSPDAVVELADNVFVRVNADDASENNSGQ